MVLTESRELECIDTETDLLYPGPFETATPNNRFRVPVITHAGEDDAFVGAANVKPCHLV